MMVRPLMGGRHYVFPGPTSCLQCLYEQMKITDAFFLSSDRLFQSVYLVSENPFLQGVTRCLASCSFFRGVSVDVASLVLKSAASVCKHSNAENKPAKKNEVKKSDRYRAQDLRHFFAFCSPDLFVSQAHGTIGPSIDYDYASLVTAKASGFFVIREHEEKYTRPWGGHCSNFSDAAKLGVLEGVERISGESPARNKVYNSSPHGVPQIGLSDFGMAADDWRIPNPTVRSWVKGHLADTHACDFVGEEVYLPERIAYYRPIIDRIPWVQESSNGCAIGGTLCEATLFGLLEVIERDAFLIAWYSKAELNPIDVTTIRSYETQCFLSRLKLCGTRVVLLDATVGVNIPTIIAVCEEPGGSTCVGAGANPDPERALFSALVEVASDFQVVARRRRQRGEELEAMLDDFSKVRVMEDHADLFANPHARPLIAHWMYPRKPMIDLHSLDCPDAAIGMSVQQDLDYVLQQCAVQGFNPLIVKLDHGLLHTLGAYCVKTIVPGLIPIDFGQYQRALHMPRLANRGRALQDTDFAPYPVPHPFP